MGYSQVASHRGMVFDYRRNIAYARALEQLVKPDTVVLDVGAGLGVLGLYAAKLGAKRVYLVEPQAVIEVAREAAKDSGLDNVECIRSTIEDVGMDIHADIITSVFTGNLLFGEDLLPSLFYARDRFLVPGGVLLPDNARVMLRPVTAPKLYDRHVDSWARYEEFCREHALPEIDYSGVSRFAANSMLPDPSGEDPALEPLAPPMELLSLDLASADKAGGKWNATAQITKSGELHGWLGWFDMQLAGDWYVASRDAGPTHWREVFLPISEPMKLEVGDRLELTLARQQYGEWSWMTRKGEHTLRQSSFLATPQRPSDMAKSVDSYKPTLNPKGQALAWALVHMTGDMSLAELHAAVQQKFPGSFNSPEELQRLLQGLARQFG